MSELQEKSSDEKHLKKWQIFRNFLVEMVEKIDSDTITIDELFWVGNCYDGCQKVDQEIDEDVQEAVRIITLGFVANMAIRTKTSQ